MSTVIHPRQFQIRVTRKVVLGLVVAAAVAFAVVQTSADRTDTSPRTADQEQLVGDNAAVALQAQLDDLYAQAAAGAISDNDPRIDTVRTELSRTQGSPDRGAAQLQVQLDGLYAQAASGAISDNDPRIDTVRTELSRAEATASSPVGGGADVVGRPLTDGWMAAAGVTNTGVSSSSVVARLQTELDGLYAQAASGAISDNDPRIDALRTEVSRAQGATSAPDDVQRPAYLIIQDEIDAALAERVSATDRDVQRPAYAIIQDEIDAALAERD